jgi:hypothetical protein
MLLFLQQALAQEWYPREKTSFIESVQKSLGSTSFWFKIIILIFAAPIWFPIVRTLLREIDSALRKEGGILARTYTARDLKALEERQGVYEDPLRSIPRGTRAERNARTTRTAPAPSGRSSAGSTGRSVRSTSSRRF